MPGLTIYMKHVVLLIMIWFVDYIWMRFALGLVQYLFDPFQSNVYHLIMPVMHSTTNSSTRMFDTADSKLPMFTDASSNFLSPPLSN